MNNTEDFLDVDKPIPGQNYVCLSFVSPENVLERKETFFLKEFLKSLEETKGIPNVEERYDLFMESNRPSLESRFFELNEFRTTVRGLKIRGVYDTKKEADVRAQVLQRLDRRFHVFVGQVGYWLPWDPNANDIDDQVYMEKELNELMKHYRENESKRDMFYEEQKNIRKSEAIKDAEKNKVATATSSENEPSSESLTVDELLQQIENEEDHFSRKSALETAVDQEVGGETESKETTA